MPHHITPSLTTHCSIDEKHTYCTCLSAFPLLSSKSVASRRWASRPLERPRPRPLPSPFRLSDSLQTAPAAWLRRPTSDRPSCTDDIIAALACGTGPQRVHSRARTRSLLPLDASCGYGGGRGQSTLAARQCGWPRFWLFCYFFHSWLNLEHLERGGGGGHS